MANKAETAALVAKLTDAQKKRFKAAYDSFDEDKSGSIDASELGALMKKLGENPTPAEVEAILTEFDSDGDGVISYEEFLGMIATQISNTQAEVTREMFKVRFGGHVCALCWARPSSISVLRFVCVQLVDTDGSSNITAANLKQVLRDIGASFTDAEIDAAIAQADYNGDGAVTLEDFTKLTVALQA